VKRIDLGEVPYAEAVTKMGHWVQQRQDGLIQGGRRSPVRWASGNSCRLQAATHRPAHRCGPRTIATEAAHPDTHRIEQSHDSRHERTCRHVLSRAATNFVTSRSW
jgi:hypothetical protein